MENIGTEFLTPLSFGWINRNSEHAGASSGQDSLFLSVVEANGFLKEIRGSGQNEKPGTRSQFELVLCGIQGFSGAFIPEMLQHGSRPLPNPRLAEIVASLNLDFFQLPAKTVP